MHAQNQSTPTPQMPIHANPLQTEIPLNLLKPNPFNPRTNAAETDFEQLGRDIAKVGLIQALTVHQDVDGTYTIIAGERRYRALMHNAKLGVKRANGTVFTENDLIPVNVHRGLSQGQITEMAISENEQRAEVNAADRFRYFTSLAEARKRDFAAGKFLTPEQEKRTLEDIAAYFGFKVEHAKRWLHVAETATSEVLTALQNKQINILQAYVIVAATPHQRAEMLRLAITEKYNPKQLEERFKKTEIFVSDAIFDLSLYPVPLQPTMFDNLSETFPDVEAFFRLQIEAARKQVQELKEQGGYKWARAVIADQFDRAQENLTACKNTEVPNGELGVVVFVNSQSGKVQFFEREQITSAPQEAPKSAQAPSISPPVNTKTSEQSAGKTPTQTTDAPREETLKYPYMVRSNFIQDVIKTNPREAKIWFLLGVARSSHVRFRPVVAKEFGMQETEQLVGCGELIKELLAGVELKEASFEHGLLELNTALGNKQQAELDLYLKLSELSDENLEQLFMSAVASHVFDHRVNTAQEQTSSLVMKEMFQKYGLTGSTYFRLNEEYLKTMSKNQLTKLADSMPVKPLLKSSMKLQEIIAAILKVSDENAKQGWMPEHFHL